MYTHKIKFQVGDGSNYLEADLGVDAETKDLIYKFTGTSQPLRDDLIDDFRQFANHVKDMSVKYGGIKNVSIIKKE